MSNMYDQMFSQPREFLLLNVRPTPVVLGYDGETPTIPARDELVMPTEGNVYKPHSAKDSQGNWISGSLLVKDIPGQRGCPDVPPEGEGRGEFWSASKAIIKCLGIDPGTKQATSTYAQSGIGLLPLNPSPELVAQTRKELQEKSKPFRARTAQDVIDTYKEQANKYKISGLEPPTPGDDYYEALATRKELQQERMERLKALGIDDPLAEPTPSNAPSLDSQFEAIAKLAAEKAALELVKGKPELDYDAVVQIMLNDPKYMDALREKAKVRKYSDAQLAKKEREVENAPYMGK